MSEIRKGDLVVVIKPTLCCGNADNVGHMFTAYVVRGGVGRCMFCGTRSYAVDAHDGRMWYELHRLKRIDPLPESERTNTTDEVTA